jgi:hypothetical protein
MSAPQGTMLDELLKQLNPSNEEKTAEAKLAESLQEAEPAVEPEAEPAVEPEAEPEAKLAESLQEAEPAVEPEAEPAVEPEAEPAVEPEAEPAVEPEAEPAEKTANENITYEQALEIVKKHEAEETEKKAQLEKEAAEKEAAEKEELKKEAEHYDAVGRIIARAFRDELENLSADNK